MVKAVFCRAGMSLCGGFVTHSLNGFFWLQTWHFLESLLTVVRTGRSPKGVCSSSQLTFRALVMHKSLALPSCCFVVVVSKATLLKCYLCCFNKALAAAEEKAA